MKTLFLILAVYNVFAATLFVLKPDLSLASCSMSFLLHEDALFAPDVFNLAVVFPGDATSFCDYIMTMLVRNRKGCNPVCSHVILFAHV